MHNPLKRAILKILKTATGPLKEHDLHKILGNSAFEQWITGDAKSSGSETAELLLFRKHFLVMNALYSLHDELLPQGLSVQISALHIQLTKRDSSAPESQSISTDTSFKKLSDYYQNWQHFENSNSEDVSKLLQQFWNKFMAHDEKQQSLACLGLHTKAQKGHDCDVSWPEIHQRYKQLCQQHHPDKGGDKLYFFEIRQAYDNLKYLYK